MKKNTVIDLTAYAADDLTRSIAEDIEKVRYYLKPSGNDDTQKPQELLSKEPNLNIQGSVTNFADLPAADEIGTIRLVTSERFYYQRQIDSEGLISWEKYSVNIQDYELGNGEETKEIEPKPNAVFSDRSDGESVVEMRGNTNYRSSLQSIPFMLAFFHPGVDGLWNNSGTADDLLLNSKSLYEYCFKYAAEMWKNSYQPFECTLRLPAHMLNEFDYTKFYKIRSTLFLVEQLKYNLEAEKITYDKSVLRTV